MGAVKLAEIADDRVCFVYLYTSGTYIGCRFGFFWAKFSKEHENWPIQSDHNFIGFISNSLIKPTFAELLAYDLEVALVIPLFNIKLERNLLALIEVHQELATNNRICVSLYFH